ncbi:unnamed protein product [Rotaria sp. Silwood2]|nr:unnamed protein product [Rotaria sp. Silwood2]CAF4094439.1 unnamed protein product [Rotaria sp. Silwood2]
MICQQHLPFIADRVETLLVAECGETPEITNLLFSYIPSISQFTNLRFLILWNIPSNAIGLKVTDELQHLRNINRLDFKFNYDCNDKVDFQLIINNIWGLQKLTHCHYQRSSEKKCYFYPPTKLSKSLINLNLSRYCFKLAQIYQLLQYTSHLKYLSIYLESDDNDQYKSCCFSTLIDLDINISGICNTSKLISLLQNLPNLRRLTISLVNVINGYQLEQIIRYYLPKLKVINVSMEEKLSIGQNIEQRVDELINSFRSSFWIDEHQWFIRCLTDERTIYIQTKPLKYSCFHAKLADTYKSTDPHDDYQEIYNTIDKLYSDSFFNQSFPSNFRLSNIEFLGIKFPIHDQFWSIVTNLKKLNSLTVSSFSDVFQSQLQTLLDRAPRLYSLCIQQDKSLPLQMSLFKCMTASVHRLDLGDDYYQFNEEECLTLSHSTLGVQCKLLFIQVINRQSIICLVKNMINLQSLHIECADDKYHPENTSNKNDLVQWLKVHLPSTCLIVRNQYYIHKIKMWIR